MAFCMKNEDNETQYNKQKDAPQFVDKHMHNINKYNIYFQLLNSTEPQTNEGITQLN